MNIKAVRIAGIVVALAVVIAAVALLSPRLSKKSFKPQQKSVSAPIKIKASGTISIIDKMVVLTTPRGTNHYLLIGSQLDKITKHSDKLIYVFGTMAKPAVSKIKDISVRAAIDVTQFDTKDFTVGSQMSDQMVQAIKQKVQEQTELRKRVLDQLRIKDVGYEVISGKMNVVKQFLLHTSQMETTLMVTDKYGDKYILYGEYKHPREAYQKLTGTDLDVVVVGEMSAPDPRRIVLDIAGPFMFFSVREKRIYNNTAELSELIIPAQ